MKRLIVAVKHVVSALVLLWMVAPIAFARRSAAVVDWPVGISEQDGRRARAEGLSAASSRRVCSLERAHRAASLSGLDSGGGLFSSSGVAGIGFEVDGETEMTSLVSWGASGRRLRSVTFDGEGRVARIVQHYGAGVGACESPRGSALVGESRRGFWLDRHRAINERSRSLAGEIEVAFIGDSLTEFWIKGPKAQRIWAAMASERVILNAGVAGDKVENALWRIEHGNLDDVGPRVVVVNIGTNNAVAGDHPAKIAEGIGGLLARIHAKHPLAQIVLMAVFPAGVAPDAAWRSKNEQVNELIVHFVAEPWITFLDIGPHLVDPLDGTLQERLFHDQVHLNHRGYRVWRQQMEPILRRLLAPRY